MRNASLKEVGMEGYDDYYPVQLSGANNNVSVSLAPLRWTQRLSSLTNPTSALDPELVGEVLGCYSQDC